jgi:hypothetical protein
LLAENEKMLTHSCDLVKVGLTQNNSLRLIDPKLILGLLLRIHGAHVRASVSRYRAFLCNPKEVKHGTNNK